MTLEKLMLYWAIAHAIGIHSYVIGAVLHHWAPLEKRRERLRLRMTVESTRVGIVAGLAAIRSRLTALPALSLSEDLMRFAREIEDAVSDILRSVEGKANVVREALRQGELIAAEKIASDVATTLRLASSLLEFRERHLPRHMQDAVQIAHMAITGIESLRDFVMERVEKSQKTLGASARALDGEHGRLRMLSNGLAAQRTLSSSDPRAVIESVMRQRVYLHEIATSAQLRQETALGVLECERLTATLIADIREREDLLQFRAAQSLVQASYAETAARMVERIDQAEADIAAAKDLALRPSADVSHGGRTYRRIRRATLLAGRAKVTVEIVYRELRILDALSRSEPRTETSDEDAEGTAEH